MLKLGETACSTCPYCGVGCGVKLTKTKEGLSVEGDVDHPANFGRLCSKGLALGETLSLDGRLLCPQVDGVDAPWNTALDLVADKFRATIERHGPDSVAFYVSGQLLTEDYYVANKLMKGFIGSANIDTNSRLCMASTVAGHKRAFGTDTVPGTYEDLELADLVILVGSNLAWCHPVLYQRLSAARKAKGTKVVVIDPRRTATCDIADLHLKIDPGADVALFNALLCHLADTNALNPAFITRATDGFEKTLASARDDRGETGLNASEMAQFFEMFRAHEKVVTVFSQGVNQSTSGTDKVNSIINCHLATGRIGHPGMGPLSVTGQPNAMGGRESGGLANMLAAHLDLENAEHRAAVQAFWGSNAIPAKPGLKAIDMFHAVRDGKIKALWIACTNPAVSLPEADVVRDAIESCDFTVVSDLSANTDTAKLADVVLPATGWAEKDGTVTNSDRTISRQRGVLPPPGEARHDWWIFAEIGKRMGWAKAFSYANPVEVFREHAALSKLGTLFGRDFDISALGTLSEKDYDALPPTQWPITNDRTGGRFFGDEQFFTSNKKARFVPVAAKPPAALPSARYPFRLNTGRVRDQWHTMTRTAKTPRLSQHLGEPYLEIHPKDADRLDLQAADLAEVSSPLGSALLRVLVTPDAALGAPFAPIHWTEEYAPAAKIGRVIAAETDPFSGQPETKAGVVSIKRYEAAWYGFVVSDRRLDLNTAYWSQTRCEKGWRAELADPIHPLSWDDLATKILGYDGDMSVVRSRTQARFALWSQGTLSAALFLSRDPVEVARDFVSAALGTAAPDILAGKPGADVPDPGPIICACMSVGRNSILQTIEDAPSASLDEICALTSAGVTCGSCRSEVAGLMTRAVLKTAAE